MKIRLVVTALAVAVTTLGITAPTQAATRVTNDNGQTLTVSKSKNLSPSGQMITVKGKGFDPRVGIYVAFCVIPPRGEQPTPCGGGVDMDGSTSASTWISSTPPPYGAAIAKPYAKNGSFITQLRVSPMIGDVDCRQVKCAVVSRADHLRASDRKFDVLVPVSFQ